MTDERERALRATQNPAQAQAEQDRRFGQPHHGHHQVPLAKDWVQPKRRFRMDEDYSSLPRFMPDFGRTDAQAYWANRPKRAADVGRS